MEMCLCGALMPGELPKGIAAAVPQEKHLQEIFYVEEKKKKTLHGILLKGKFL